MRRVLRFAVVVGSFLACSDVVAPVGDRCAALPTAFSGGSANGHAAPYGAKAAGQARAGRLVDPALVVSSPDARQKVRVGDFVLVNDRVAVFIEDAGASDGYDPHGGEIIAVDLVGDDGRPRALSRFGETLFTFAAETIQPTSVTVLADGSDGKEAIVRAVGTLRPVPFLDRFRALFGVKWELPVAYDYVLAPGSSKVVVRVTVAQNEPEQRIATGLGGASMAHFQSSMARVFTPDDGFAGMKGDTPWLGFDAGEASYAIRFAGGDTKYGIDVSGFLNVYGPDRTLEACAIQTFDFAELVIGGPGIDGLREAMRRTDGLPASRRLSGVVRDAEKNPVGGVVVHAVGADGKLLTRAATDGTGSYALQVPRAPVTLTTYAKGRIATSRSVGESEPTADVDLAPSGFIQVRARDSGDPTRAVPVRVQVVPTVPLAPTNPAFGELDELGGRIHQEFAVSGDALLAAPPGEHTVIVTRGYEWEKVEKTVTVVAGKTVAVDAPMIHSVDSTGTMCADFHIHSFYSLDSSDPVEHKVRSAIADGLDVPFSSEHEWIVDFAPVVKKLGLEDWAFGGSSEELTTFAWGHFGIVPIEPDPEAQNNGAIGWVGRTPDEVFASVAALPQKPVLIVNHPRGQPFLAYFDATQFDRDAVASKSPLWSWNFGAIEVTNDSSFDDNRTGAAGDWLAMLKSGRTTWAVGSSDSHFVRSQPTGYPRTCLRFGHDDPRKLTNAAVRDALRAGAATVSGGLTMKVTGPGGEGPGETIKNPGPTMTFTITVASPTFIDASELETIVDAKTIATEPLVAKATPTGRLWENQVTIPKAGSGRGFVVFHARGKGDLAPLHPGRAPFAFSNPIFF